MTLPDSEIIEYHYQPCFRYDDVTFGDPTKGFLLRYRGQLVLDSFEAYDQLADALASLRNHPALPY